MALGEVQRYPIEVLVNYWEIQPPSMGAHLDGLTRQGITHIASFVPWQALESDISHSLLRFLAAVGERKMTLSLILTPEVGVHFTNSGVPKDILSKDENIARLQDGSKVSVNLPPNAHALPSLFAPEFKKRYFGYLNKLDGMLADALKSQQGITQHVTLVLSGSFWKYYRAPRACLDRVYGALAGDYCNAGSLAYRQHLDQYYSQKEFADSPVPAPLAASRWKERQFDEANRRYFHQHSEEIFRNRTYQQFRRKSSSYAISEVELYAPEADPSLHYARFMSALEPGWGSFERLSALIDESIARASFGATMETPPWVFWTSMGHFGGGFGAGAGGGISDAERQFLVLKSLLLSGGRGGGILVEEKDWLSLSPSFRAKAERIASFLAHRDLRLGTDAVYFTPHLWSRPGQLWEELHRKLGVRARVISSMDAISQETEAKLILADPQTVFTRDLVLKLSALMRSGTVVAIPRTPLFTETAREEMEKVCSEGRKLEISLGIPYQLNAIEQGKLILYDLPTSLSGQAAKACEQFVQSLLAVAEVEPDFGINQPPEGMALELVTMKKRRGGQAVFVLNRKPQKLSSEIRFGREIFLSDLAKNLGGRLLFSDALPARRLPLEIPAFGVVPLALDGLADIEKRNAVPQASLKTELGDPNPVHKDHGTDLRLV